MAYDWTSGEATNQALLAALGGGGSRSVYPGIKSGYAGDPRENYDVLIDVLGPQAYLQLLGFNPPGNVDEQTWGRTGDYSKILDSLREYGTSKYRVHGNAAGPITQSHTHGGW